MKTPVIKAAAMVLSALLIIRGLPASAQNEFGGIVRFDKLVHDFGDILITSGSHECTFTVTNIGNSPIAINRVISSCGCTEPEWTKMPIMPGEKGHIAVTFKNDQGPYPFDKSITVYVSGLPRPVILKVRGIVHERKKSIGELFPVHYGPIGLHRPIEKIKSIDQGLAVTTEFEMANISGKNLGISFCDITPGMSISISPNPIPASGKSKVTCTVDTRKTDGEKWGRTRFSASVTAGGKEYRDAITVETVIRDNFSELSESEKRIGALPQFTSSSCDLGVTEEGKEYMVTFNYRNIGKSELIIYKVDPTSGIIEGKAEFSGKTPPGGEGSVTYTLIPENLEEGEEGIGIITLITNSPSRPVINLFITYTQHNDR